MSTDSMGVVLSSEVNQLLMIYAAKNGLRSKGDAIRDLLNKSPELRAFAEAEGIEYELPTKGWGGKRDKDSGKGQGE